MSKRAEAAAMKAYPDYPSMDGGYVTQRKQRHCYIKGYEQAEKDTIERAISVLVNLPSLVIPSNYIAYFREKMMEEDNG